MRKEYLTKENIAWLLLAVGSFVICSLLMNLGIINSYYQITLYNICINIILAVSLNLVIGICGQFSLGHAGFMCIGAYAAGIITKMMPNFGGFVLGILVGFVLSAIVALIVSIPTLRLRGDYLAIATLGLLVLLIKAIRKKKDKKMQYLTYWCVFITLTSIASGPILFYYQIVSIMTVLYLIYGKEQNSNNHTQLQQQ